MITIDPEFKALIPPLLPEERKGLEESILKEGCRDALVVWKGHNILVDGHNRYEICTAHGKPFETVEMEFASRDDAMVWIIDNQFSRRNLTPFIRGELALKRKHIIAAKAKKNQQLSEGRGVKGCQNSDNLIERVDTKKELAKIAGVSRWDNAPDTKPFPVEPGRASRKRHNAARKRPHRPLTARAARPDPGP